MPLNQYVELLSLRLLFDHHKRHLILNGRIKCFGLSTTVFKQNLILQGSEFSGGNGADGGEAAAGVLVFAYTAPDRLYEKNKALDQQVFFIISLLFSRAYDESEALIVVNPQ